VAWANQIAALLDAGAPTLVAVGAMHLLGPENLRNQLTKNGITVERLA
jgi:uncharacterized protein YbaP (TraB family)